MTGVKGVSAVILPGGIKGRSSNSGNTPIVCFHNPSGVRFRENQIAQTVPVVGQGLSIGHLSNL